MKFREEDDPANGLGRYALEDFVGDFLGRVILRILEYRPNRQSRALYEPGTGYLARNPFNVLALRPIRVWHGTTLDIGWHISRIDGK